MEGLSEGELRGMLLRIRSELRLRAKSDVIWILRFAQNGDAGWGVGRCVRLGGVGVVSSTRAAPFCGTFDGCLSQAGGRA